MAYFFFNTQKSYIVTMLSLFNNIIIQKEDGRQTRVPLVWGSKEKAVVVNESDGMNTSTVFPKMALTLVGIHFDTTRKTNKFAKAPISISETGDTTYQYNSVPYNFDFQLSIRTKNLADYWQISEQILPYFNPSISKNINEIPGRPSTSISITLGSVDVAPDEDYGGEEEARFITGTLNFILKGNIYPPIKDGGVAKTIEIKYQTEEDGNSDLATLIGTVV